MRNFDAIVFDWVKSDDNREMLRFFIASSKKEILAVLEDPKNFLATAISMQDPNLLWLILDIIKKNPEIVKGWSFEDVIYICQIFNHETIKDQKLSSNFSEDYKRNLLTHCIVAELLTVFVQTYFNKLADNPFKKEMVFSQILSKLQNSKFELAKKYFLCEGLKLFATNKEDLQFFLDSIPKSRADGSNYFPVNYHTQFYVDCIKRDPNIGVVSQFLKNFDQQILAKAGCQNLRDLFINVLVPADSKYLLEFLNGVEGMFYAAATFQKLSSLTSISTQQKVSSAGNMILEVAPELLEMVINLTQVHQNYCMQRGENCLSK